MNNNDLSGAERELLEKFAIAADAVQSLDELRILYAYIAAVKSRLLALADAAQHIHDAYDPVDNCPLANDLRKAAALL